MGRLLDCAATSVIFPAHDGQVGILYGHIPMLCQLGLGLMDVTTSLSEADPAAQSKKASFFIDGGFALVALNTLTIVAYEAVDVQAAKIERLKSMLDKASRGVADPALPPKQRRHQNERLRILARVVESRPSERD
jgi:F0F1-type ATP synthase epsilon subunit